MFSMKVQDMINLMNVVYWATFIYLKFTTNTYH